jgi:hypothetical protein
MGTDPRQPSSSYIAFVKDAAKKLLSSKTTYHVHPTKGKTLVVADPAKRDN